MNKLDIVKKAFNFDNLQENFARLSDDFQFTDSVGGAPMDKSGWTGMGSMLQASFPDIAFIIEDIREEGDGVIVTGHNAGTFSNDMDLSAMGMGVIAATGKAVAFPSNTMQLSFDGDKVSKAHSTETGPHAGMGGFFKALGVEMG